MAELIQFHCPGCGVVLRLPLSMAGSEGPCPRCGRPIIAPMPDRGLGPRVVVRPTPHRPPLEESGLLTLPVETSIEEPEPPPVTASRTQVSDAPFPHPVPEYRRRPQLAVFVLSLILTAVLSLTAGFLLGSGPLGRKPNSIPIPGTESRGAPSTQADAPPMVAVVKPPAEPPPPVPGPVQPPLEKTQLPVPNPEPVQTSAAAEAALKAFLDAPDWMTRSAHVLYRDRVRSSMESYSHKVPDGPSVYTEIKRKDTFLDKESGASYFVFYVFTEKHPNGFPTVVAETKSGWLVDWEAFVEFRDHQFDAFAEGAAGQSGRFHLLASTPPPSRAANTENESFASFLIGPPGAETARIAYVRKNTEAHTTLASATKEGAVFAPVLDVAKRGTADGKSYLEIVSVVAPRWLPEPAE